MGQLRDDIVASLPEVGFSMDFEEDPGLRQPGPVVVNSRLLALHLITFLLEIRLQGHLDTRTGRTILTLELMKGPKTMMKPSPRSLVAPKGAGGFMEYPWIYP